MQNLVMIRRLWHCFKQDFSELCACRIDSRESSDKPKGSFLWLRITFLQLLWTKGIETLRSLSMWKLFLRFWISYWSKWGYVKLSHHMACVFHVFWGQVYYNGSNSEKIKKLYRADKNSRFCLKFFCPLPLVDAMCSPSG